MSDFTPENTPDFDGETYDPALDHDRLSKQLGRTYDVMRDEAWRTLSEIASVYGDPEASISARLRDLRKKKFGGYIVNHRRRTESLWEYQVLKAKKSEQIQMQLP